MWTPTHVVVTVTKGRNLLEKGKNGNDAYCIIGLGKEKYLTSVKQKTTNPVWDEQAEFSLGDREDLKITLYHKSSIIDEFLGRAVINISELACEKTNNHVQWYKLMSKPDKESKKPEKERGEIEVRIEFLVKPKAGSILDLSKSKDKSLSIRSLKDKTSSIKSSIGDKFKSLQQRGSKKSKFNGENQLSLAEQAKRMGGSKLDFLEGEDISSLTSSYSSINGPTLMRANELKQMTAVNRYTSSRSSHNMSESSSINEADSASQLNASKFEAHNEDDEYKDNNNVKPNIITDNNNKSVIIDEEEVEDDDDIDKHIKNYQFERNTRLTSSIRSNTKPQSSSTPSVQTRLPHEQPKKSDLQHKPSITKVVTHTKPAAQMAPITVSTTTADNKQHNSESLSPLSPLPLNDSFASIFNDTIEKQQQKQQSVDTRKQQQQQTPSTKSTTSSSQHQQLSSNRSTVRKFENSFTTNDDDEDIDWASSDEEIVKQEMETFERNQVMRQSERRKLVPKENLISDLKTPTDEIDVKIRKSNLQINFNQQQNKQQSNNRQNKYNNNEDDDIKTPDIDLDFGFQENQKKNSDASSIIGSKLSTNRSELPDVINQKGNNDSNKPSDKAKKYLEGLDGITLNEISVPDSLKKQLEFFDREDLLQLIAYQKKYLDYKESRIKDLDNYIDNLVLKVLETSPALLMQAGSILQARK